MTRLLEILISLAIVAGLFLLWLSRRQPAPVVTDLPGVPAAD